MMRHGPTKHSVTRMLSCVVLVLLAVTAGACTGGEGGGAEEQQTIRFAWWGDSERLATTRKVLEAFEQENPGIKVEVETSGDTTAYFEKLATEMAANDAPDLMTLGGAYPREYSDRGALLDLGTVSEQLDLSRFEDSTLEASTFDGKRYGVPTGGNAIGLVINPSIFAEAGVELPDTATWTWQQFAETAAKITANTPKGTFGFEPRINDTLGVYAQQRGTPIFDADGQLSVGTDTVADYWRMELEMVESEAVPSAAAIQELANASPEQTLMGQGKAAMTIAYSNLLGTYADASGEELQLATIPGAGEFNYPGPTVLPSQYYAIDARSESPDAAASLLGFLVNSPTAGKLIMDDRGMPFQSEVRAAIEPELDQYGKAGVEYLDAVESNGTPTAPIPPAGASSLNDVSSRFDSEVLFGRMSPDDAAAAWHQELQDSLDRAQ